MLKQLKMIEAAACGFGPLPQSGGSNPEIFKVAEQLRRSGLPLARAARAGVAQVRRGERLADSGKRLLLLFQARHALGSLAAIAVRIGAQRAVAGSADFVAARAFDSAAIALAILSAFAVALTVRKRLPQAWTSDAALVALWIHGCAGGTPSESAPWHLDLKELMRREILAGVSFAAERRAMLIAWARTRHDAVRDAVERLGDLLPLYELLGIGVPAALILAVPLWTLVKGGAS